MATSETANAVTQEGRAYDRLTITLHWLIGALILIQIGLGVAMNEAMVDHSPAQEQVQDFHITLGLTTLVLVAIRIVVALTRRAPPLPAGLPRWEVSLAGLSKLVFYLLMVAFVMSGWMMVTARHEHASFWGLTWPELPGMGAFTGKDHRAARGQLQTWHNYTLMWIFLGVLFLHVAGSIKHQFDGHPVLWRMLPFLKPQS